MENHAATSNITRTKNPVKAILIIGLIAGTLDITTAIIYYKVAPLTMGQVIASGAVGREAAFAGGLPMSLLGWFFHYFIATTWATIFFLLYPRIKILSTWNSVVVGLLYGVVVWIGMNRIVLPLSQIKQGPFNLTQALIGMTILMIMIGLPISVLTRRYYSANK